jgi:hypothetical protein
MTQKGQISHNMPYADKEGNGTCVRIWGRYDTLPSSWQLETSQLNNEKKIPPSPPVIEEVPTYD